MPQKASDLGSYPVVIDLSELRPSFVIGWPLNLNVTTCKNKLCAIAKLHTLYRTERSHSNILEKNMTAKLTKEEKEILDSFEKGEWVPVSNLPKRRKKLAEYACNTLKRTRG